MGKKRKKNQIQNKNYVDPEKRVVSETIEMTQEFCYFDFDSPWEQMKKKTCEKLQKGMGNNENKRRNKKGGKATVISPCLLEYYLTSCMTRVMSQVFFLYKKYI
jgi:hypothetical protein